MFSRFLKGSKSQFIRSNWIYLCALLLFVLIGYFNAFHGELVSDDIFAIRDSEHLLRRSEYLLTSPTFIARSILYFIAYRIGGLNPFFYRISNVVFHIGVTFVVYLIVPFFSKRKFLPFIVAAFTAVHPIMIESVTWISGGIYAQSAFFMLLSFYLYLKYRLNNKKAYFIFSILFFLISLSSSEKVIVFPAILFLYESVFHKVKDSWKKIIPYGIASILYFLTRIPDIAPRMEFIQADSGITIQPINPLIQIPVVIYTYLKLLFWPPGLT